MTDPTWRDPMETRIRAAIRSVKIIIVRCLVLSLIGDLMVVSCQRPLPSNVHGRMNVELMPP